MPHRHDEDQAISRRTFLNQMRWAPVLFLPAPICSSLIRPGLQQISAARAAFFPFSDVPFAPHYPAKSPLDDVLRLAAPGTDEYVIEGYAFELAALLEEWGRRLTVEAPAITVISKFVDCVDSVERVESNSRIALTRWRSDRSAAAGIRT